MLQIITIFVVAKLYSLNSGGKYMTLDEFIDIGILVSMVMWVVGFIWLLVKIYQFWRRHGTAVVLTIALVGSALIGGVGWAIWYWWDTIETYAPYVFGIGFAIWFVSSGCLTDTLRDTIMDSGDSRKKRREQEDYEWGVHEYNKEFSHRMWGHD